MKQSQFDEKSAAYYNSKKFVQEYKPQTEIKSAIVYRTLQLIKKYYKNKDGIVLDIGCASGDILSRIPASQKFGVDVSKQLLVIAKKRGINVKKIDLNKERLQKNFKKDYFDLIICTCVAEHLSDIQVVRSLIDDSYNLLKKQGIIIFTTDSLESYYDLIPSFAQKKKITLGKPGGHIHLFTKKEIRDLFKNYNIIHYHTSIFLYDSIKSIIQKTKHYLSYIYIYIHII